jgi:hypothetical protein
VWSISIKRGSLFRYGRQGRCKCRVFRYETRSSLGTEKGTATFNRSSGSAQVPLLINIMSCIPSVTDKRLGHAPLRPRNKLFGRSIPRVE